MRSAERLGSSPGEWAEFKRREWQRLLREFLALVERARNRHDQWYFDALVTAGATRERLGISERAWEVYCGRLEGEAP